MTMTLFITMTLSFCSIPLWLLPLRFVATPLLVAVMVLLVLVLLFGWLNKMVVADAPRYVLGGVLGLVAFLVCLLCWSLYGRHGQVRNGLTA